MRKYFLHIALVFCFIQQFHSQENGIIALDIPVRNSLKFNRYIVNPTFSFVREQNKYLSITNKRQWVQFDDAPQTYVFSYSGRFRENIGIGVGAFQQNYGVLTNFGGVLNFAYNAVINRDSNLTFGMNLGFYQSGLNSGKVVTNFPDPSLDNIPNNSILTINPGINYGTEFFDFGVSVNNAVSYNFNTSNIVEDNPEQGIQAHIMYTGYMNSRGFFDESKFSTLLRSEFKKDETIISGLLMLTVPKGIWAQAGYNSLYGMSAGIGINITKQIAIEYNYEKAIGDLSTFGNSHDITLAYKFRNKNRYSYSGDDEEEALLSGAKRKRVVSKPNGPKVTQADRVAIAQAKEEARVKAIEKAKAKADARAKLVEASKAKREARIKAATDKRENEQKATKTELEETTANKEAEEQQKVDEVARIKQEQEAKTKAEEEIKVKAEEEARTKLEAQKRTEEEAEARLVEESKAKAEEAARIQKELEEAKAKAEEEEKIKLAEEKAKAEEVARLKLEVQERAKAEEAARIKQEQEAKIKAKEEAKLKLEAETKAKAEEEAKIKLEEENRLKIEAEEKAAVEEDPNIQVIEEDAIIFPYEKDEDIRIMNDLTKLTVKTRIEQENLLIRLKEKVANKQQDLDDLKEENDLSEQGIFKAPKAFKSVSAENAALESLKQEIDTAIKSQDEKINELETLYQERLKTVSDTNDETNAFYLKTINELKSAQLRIIQSRDQLDATLEQIKVATDFERKRRIKRAAYDNEEDRYQKDRAALTQITQFTPQSGSILNEDDFDFGETLGSNIQIVKDVKHIDSGYYLVLAVHSDVEKRDEFLTKVVSQGQSNIDFFYDVSTSKYYIYQQKFNGVEQARKAIESKGDEPYNSKMSLVKIEN